MEDYVIHTDRLMIQPLSDSAIQTLIGGESDPEMKQAYCEMLSGCQTHPDARAWYTVWVMRLRGTDEAVGDLCFKGLSPDGRVEIGYGMYGDYEGHGYMTEAVIAMTAWAVSQPGVTRVEAETAPDNAASQRVLAKAGFVPTGELGEEGPRFVYIGPRG